MNKIIIIVANFYPHIAKMLIDGAVSQISQINQEIKKAKKEEEYCYEIIEVPGAFEIPVAIKIIAKSPKYKNDIAGFVALGCVIRGETTHYDYVCLESARGINKLAMKYELPIGYGIITAENERQAIERADKNSKNKGGNAVNACIEIIKLKKAQLQ